MFTARCVRFVRSGWGWGCWVLPVHLPSLLPVSRSWFSYLFAAVAPPPVLPTASAAFNFASFWSPLQGSSLSCRVLGTRRLGRLSAPAFRSGPWGLFGVFALLFLGWFCCCCCCGPGVRFRRVGSGLPSVSHHRLQHRCHHVVFVCFCRCVSGGFLKDKLKGAFLVKPVAF